MFDISAGFKLQRSVVSAGAGEGVDCQFEPVGFKNKSNWVVDRKRIARGSSQGSILGRRTRKREAVSVM